MQTRYSLVIGPAPYDILINTDVVPIDLMPRTDLTDVACVRSNARPAGQQRRLPAMVFACVESLRQRPDHNRTTTQLVVSAVAIHLAHIAGHGTGARGSVPAEGCERRAAVQGECIFDESLRVPAFDVQCRRGLRRVDGPPAIRCFQQRTDFNWTAVRYAAVRRCDNVDVHLQSLVRTTWCRPHRPKRKHRQH